MSNNFLRINNGITFNAQSSTPSSPSNGDIYYDSTLNIFRQYVNGTWCSIVGDTLTQLLTNKTLDKVVQNTTNDSTSTGSSTTLAVPTTGVVNLTNASLASISGITAGSNGQLLLLENDTGSTVNILNGDTGATAANRIYTGTQATVSLSNQATLVFCYNSTNSRWMLVAGSGGSNSGTTGSTVLTNGVTSQVITISPAQPSTNYVVVATLVNLVDASPSFQPVLITAKTNSSFTVQFNSPLDSANYKLDWKILNSSSAGMQVKETAISISSTTINVTFPIAFATTSYVVTAELVNYTDSNPQFQSIVITAKTTTGFTAQWNAPTDSANYLLASNAS